MELSEPRPHRPALCHFNLLPTLTASELSDIIKKLFNILLGELLGTNESTLQGPLAVHNMGKRTIGWFVWGHWSDRFWRWNGLVLSLTDEKVIARFLGIVPVWETRLSDIKEVCRTGFDFKLLAPGIRTYYTKAGKIEHFTFGVFRSHKRVLEIFREARIKTDMPESEPLQPS
jgi:hypothetical protein